jgi:hypothetical protein
MKPLTGRRPSISAVLDIAQTYGPRPTFLKSLNQGVFIVSRDARYGALTGRMLASRTSSRTGFCRIAATFPTAGETSA